MTEYGKWRSLIDGAGVIPDSGVARLTLDNADTSGGSALDVWNTNDATINGATTGVSGANQTYATNEAYSFDGTDDRLSFGDALLNGPPATLAAWFKTTQKSELPAIISNRDSADADDILSIQTANGKVRGSVRDSSRTIITPTSTSTVNNGEWYHVCLTVGSSTTRLYVDASEEASASTPGGSYSLDDVRIGATQAGDSLVNFFAGDIDDVRFYDKALTSTEVSNLYNTGSISG